MSYCDANCDYPLWWHASCDHQIFFSYLQQLLTTLIDVSLSGIQKLIIDERLSASYI
jgi:hypothetical protein